MNIRCPHCHTVFRVNPERIPPTGVRAKCARCAGSFMVAPPHGAGDRPGQTAGASPAGARTAAATAAPRPGAAAEAARRPATTPAPTAPGTATQAGARAAAPGATRPGFGARDPKARAERLARALVSDIVAYHPERRDRSIEKGNLRSEFREEIMKSWEEYVAQVGIDLAKSTPYFRDALNAILAKGQKVF
jgi:predicted Zn finger-like uncharacterized protein